MCIRDRSGGGGGIGGGGFAGGGGTGGEVGGILVAGFCLLFSVVVIFIIILSVVLVSRSTDSESDIPDLATDFYSPGDSRLLSLSSFFYDRVYLEVDSQATGASLALVNSPPPLTDQNSFNISDGRNLNSREFRFWQYYLYPNSNVSVNVMQWR